MILDAAAYDGEDLLCDLCIAGGGAAGLSIALQFIGRKEKVVVLEGGGMEYSEESQALYRGEIAAREYYPLDIARLRYFGGSTNHWNGQCRPMDPLDFASRPWVPYSGWPIGAGDLQRYRSRAHEILDLGPDVYEAEALLPNGSRLLELDPELLVHRVWRFSPPTRFKEKYQAAFAAADNVIVLLHANVVDIVLEDDLHRTSALDVALPDRRRLGVGTPRGAFVLALGGLENPRLMLNASRQIPAGVGNQHDLVGRFFMEHPEDQPTAMIVPTDPLDFPPFNYRSGEASEHPYMIGICVSEAAQERAQILNHSVQVRPVELRATMEGFRALRELLRGAADGDFSDLGRDLQGVLLDLGGTSRGLYDYLTETDAAGGAILRSRTEQAPNPDSRVRLTDQVDRIGLRRIALEWRLSALDRETIRVANELLARELGRLGQGRLRLPQWLEEEDGGWSESVQGGYHHMGTTRMAGDPKQGVVDRDCRVHGIDNLYIAGSSVFTTGGFANPTLTIVELALRLADHLKASGSAS